MIFSSFHELIYLLSFPSQYFIHNVGVQTAFFKIDSNTPHGADLVCSHPTCRDGGIKFAYCKYCDAPIAKRSFRQHSHESLIAGEEKMSTKVSKKNPRHHDSEEDGRKPSAKKRQKVSITERSDDNVSSSPLNALNALAEAAAVAAPRGIQASAAGAPGAQGGFNLFQIASGLSETSSFSASSGTRPRDEGESNDSLSTHDEQNEDKQRLDAAAAAAAAAVIGHNYRENDREKLRREWLALLEARGSVQSADEMSSWLMRVLAISEQVSGADKHNISDDDENDSSSNDNSGINSGSHDT
jgi:hypothetical protein